MSTATHEFYNTEKDAWVDAHSVTSDEEAERMNKLIGRPFYIRKEAA